MFRNKLRDPDQAIPTPFVKNIQKYGKQPIWDSFNPRKCQGNCAECSRADLLIGGQIKIPTRD